ncbi:lipopolysaccharide transport periplasmic protein LptA [Pseudidiomarina sediminum]|nr:lipopolysaccharide transport periplasmic protein LptA [Pseudidiomarina sediminum]MBY6063916.1 lipopolysaccharide transport periplasmic protein LptA [Pseudidiomarina sediminum]
MQLNKSLNIVAVGALLLAGLMTVPGYAQGKEDFTQDIEIGSENQWFDIQNKVAVFEQNAIITQGSLKITADYLEVAEDEAQAQRVFTAKGKPATYQQQLEDGGMIRAEAETIRYDEGEQLLTLIGTVKVTQDGNVTQGHELVYNFATQHLRAVGGEDGNTRVTTILKPSKKTEDEEKNEPINR